ncbi:MAG: response regulator [Planctomycetota bacterium]|jgi:two-component system response regulator
MENLTFVKILLVEDDTGDQKLIKNSLLDQKIGNHLFIVETAEDALDYLEASKGDDVERPKPDLILLDLNMPGIGGKEFLKRIKADDELDTIPVVVLTTSDSEQDILESYKLHASGYVKKPVTLEGFEQVMRELEAYWFVICKRVSQKELACR